ncbi:hypothetical protein ACFVYR_01865 [Streptomyces sp. NPDC058284]|uniref:hypothetical protein n=1 Tax=unclassified Streptomyces TaxID=2593676 RepID=UPI003659149B
MRDFDGTGTLDTVRSPRTRTGAAVLSVMSSTVVPGAVSTRARPFSVTSRTAVSMLLGATWRDPERLLEIQVALRLLKVSKH